MNIAVFGAYGQLGRSIKDIHKDYPQHNFIFTDEDEVDITENGQIEDFVAEHKPQVFINCAAYTAVDKAEKYKQQAFDLNTCAVGLLALIAAENDIFLLHVSTDYVFNGKNYKPYKESDKSIWLSVYGGSKRRGEINILKSKCRAAIVRTSWLYSEYGGNFVKTMLRLSKEREQINIVCDQIGTPTYAGDLARAIMEIVIQNEKIQEQEIFHYSNEGVASWYDFAIEIMRLAKKSTKILPIFTEDYPTPAIRPYYSVLDKREIKLQFSINIPYWKDSLEVCIRNILNEKE